MTTKMMDSLLSEDLFRGSRLVCPKKWDNLLDRRALRLIAWWNKFAKEEGFPVVKVVNTGRVRKAAARIRTYPNKGTWREVFRAIRKSKALHDRKACSWFGFDWLVRSDITVQKVLDNWMAWMDEKVEREEKDTTEYSPRDKRLANILVTACGRNELKASEVVAVARQIRLWKRGIQVFMAEAEFLRWYGRFIHETQEWRRIITPSQLGTDSRVWKEFLVVLRKSGVHVDGNN